MLAFLSAVANNEKSKISIIVAESETIELSSIPILFNANFGYIEPNDEERLIPIDNYLDQEDYYEELDNTTDDA